MGYILDLRKLVGHRPLLMPAAALVIGDGNGNVLLQLRADDKTWENHGGSIELDEKVEDALIREVKEELGITIIEYNLLNIYSGPNYHNVYPNGDEVSCIDITYYSHKFAGEISLQEDEVLEVAWFNKDNLPHNLHHNSKQALMDYFQMLENR